MGLLDSLRSAINFHRGEPCPRWLAENRPHFEHAERISRTVPVGPHEIERWLIAGYSEDEIRAQIDFDMSHGHSPLARQPIARK